jgi:thymidylate kinase
MEDITRVLVEGPDCSGKSTLIERVKNILKWDSKSLHHQEGDQFERYVKEYLSNKNTVFDRGHFSEAVYGDLWRGGNPFSKEEMDFLNFFLKKNSIIILACPEYEILQERYNTRKFEQQIKIDELKKCRQLFIDYLANIPHIIYHSSSYKELDNLVLKIKAEIK